MTLKEKLVKRVSELEKVIENSNKEIAAITNQLKDTPDALLERDPDSDKVTEIERKNAYLRLVGLIH